MIALLAALLLAPQDAVALLRDKDPVVRRNACETLGALGGAHAIQPLVQTLGDPDAAVAAAAMKALERLAGPIPNADPAKWREWWEREGRVRFPSGAASSSEVRKEIDKLETEIKDAGKEIRILSITVAFIAIAFVLVMIYFVGHVSSKLKEWKELVKQAGVYIEESQQITKRTDHVLQELEAKKLDILEFVKKLKEEKEGEIERYADLLQQNTEHKMREEVMALRQKAERELQETLGQLRQQIDLEVRRLAGDQKEKIERDLAARHERFLAEVDAHTVFLQAAFSQANGKPEEALRLYKRVTAMKPDHRVAWEKMGNVLAELQRYDEAIESYEKAVGLDANDPSPYYNMAATYARQKKREKMLETLTLAIKNDGEFKDEALNDPAFREYWNDPAFKDLAEA